MDFSTGKFKFNTDSYRDHNYLQTEYLTYYKKLRNEIEAIPKEYKKYFRNSLQKHTFDMEVYIPTLNEANKKEYPNKNYLINKLIKYEKFLHLIKNKKEKSMGLANFSKYNYIIENNIQQKNYLNNLLQIYKDKGYEVENIEYKKNDNIFTKSILLDHKIGEDINKDVQKFGINEENKRYFIHDNRILLKFNDIIHKNRSPNAKIKFNDNENKYAHHHFNKIISSNENRKKKKEIKTKIKKKKKVKNKNDGLGISSIEEGLINTNINLNKNTQINSCDNIIKSNTLIESTNKDEENNNNSNNNSKTITTYYGNDSLVFNESKNNVENHNINKKEKEELNIKTCYSYDKKISKTKFNNNLNNKTISNKYLLSSINKTLQEKDYNNNFSGDNEFFRKSVNKSNLKTNLKLCLPEIKSTSSSNSIAKKTFKRYLTNNKLTFINPCNDKTSLTDNNSKQSKIRKLKKMFSKGYNKSNKSNFAKNKNKEINNLFSTINRKPNIFENFPYNKVTNYFLTYKNIKINKINPNKGSNIHPLLDGLEDIVEGKELYKIAKSLNDTKKDMYLRSTGTLDNFDKIETLDFEKIKDSDNKIPLLKYDFAENILCQNNDFIKNHKK